MIQTVNNQSALRLAYRFLCPVAIDLVLAQHEATSPFHPLRYVFGPKGSFEHDDSRDIEPVLDDRKINR